MRNSLRVPLILLGIATLSCLTMNRARSDSHDPAFEAVFDQAKWAYMIVEDGSDKLWYLRMDDSEFASLKNAVRESSVKEITISTNEIPLPMLYIDFVDPSGKACRCSAPYDLDEMSMMIPKWSFISFASLDLSAAPVTLSS